MNSHAISWGVFKDRLWFNNWCYHAAQVPVITHYSSVENLVDFAKFEWNNGFQRKNTRELKKNLFEKFKYFHRNKNGILNKTTKNLIITLSPHLLSFFFLTAHFLNSLPFKGYFPTIICSNRIWAFLYLDVYVKWRLHNTVTDLCRLIVLVSAIQQNSRIISQFKQIISSLKVSQLVSYISLHTNFLTTRVLWDRSDL